MGTFDRVNWPAHKPAWWLTRDAKSRDVGTSSESLAELYTRLETGKLTAEQAAPLVEYALQLQSQRDGPWLVQWGNLLQAARRRRYMTDEQWRLYAKQAIEGAFALKSRAKFRPGDRMFFRLEDLGGRVGVDGPFTVQARAEGIVLDGKELDRQTDANILDLRLTSGSGGGAWLPITCDKGLLDGLSAGEHRGFLRLHVKATDQREIFHPPDDFFTQPARTAAEQRALQMRFDAFYFGVWQNMPTVADVELKLPIEFTIVSANDSPLKRVDDEQYRSMIQECIGVEKVIVRDGVATLKISCTQSPIELSYAVLLRGKDQEWPIGRLKSQYPNAWGMVPLFELDRHRATVPDAALGATVDVIFRPDPTGAAGDPWVFEYWGGELVFKNIPVDYASKLESPAATRPVR